MPGMCNYGYVPLSHLGSIVTRKKQQRAEYFVESAPHVGLDKGSERDEKIFILIQMSMNFFILILIFIQIQIFVVIFVRTL